MKTNLGPGQRGPNIKLELDNSFGPIIDPHCEYFVITEIDDK